LVVVTFDDQLQRLQTRQKDVSVNKKKNGPVKTKKPWPTKDAMEQVYQMKLWGEGKSGFYSGIGSHHPDIVAPYVEAVKSFLTSFETPLVVCDLGCGDFNVGQKLVEHARKYIAADIVPDLIERNRKTFEEDNLEFQCLDIASDPLPSGDCIILRQVLQHLSNGEVQRVVKKLSDFKYVILTEHLPEGEFRPNKDIISGQGIRLKKQSGLDLLSSPFNLKIKGERQFLSLQAKESRGVIVTTLYEMF